MTTSAPCDGASKTFVRGTHRAIAPEQTWHRIAPHFPQFGITRVADVTGLDEVAIPVCVAVRPNGLTMSVAQGKGVTLPLARVSAAMEAIEFWHVEHLDPPAEHGVASVMGSLGYPLTDLHLSTPSLLSNDVSLGWIEGRTLVTDRRTVVPWDYVAMSSVVQQRWAPPLFRASSNGLASGNTLEEAIAHGLYEVIERDCVFLLHRLPFDQRPQVDLDTVDDPDCRWLLERYAAANNFVEAFDATTDVGVPCYEAHAWSSTLPIFFRGAGCHLDPAVALSRALTEAAQARLTTITGTRDDLHERLYTLQSGPPARPPVDLAGPVVEFGRWPDLSAPSFGADLALLARRVVHHRGIEPIVVDLSRSDLPLAVAKVVVPGLEFDTGQEEARNRRPRR